MGLKRITSAETFQEAQILRQQAVGRAVEALLDPKKSQDVRQDVVSAEMQNFFDAFVEAGTYAQDFVNRLRTELAKKGETLEVTVEQHLLQRDIDPEMGPQIPFR